MLRTLLVVLAALAALPASASAGGIAVELERGQAGPLVGRAWHAHVTVYGCRAFEYFGVDPEAPVLVFRHARSGRTVRMRLSVDRDVVRPSDAPSTERYVGTVRLPRAGLWRAAMEVDGQHRQEAFGFDVRAKRPARR
jgi:hypothetical protein